MSFIVLDEIDALSRSAGDRQLLYQLFELPVACPGAVLLCASNLLDLTARLPALEAAAYRPACLQFAPYTRKELCDIVIERLSRQPEEGRGKGIGCGVKMEEKALEMLAGRVANESGDVRKLLDVCSQAAAQLPEGVASVGLPLALRVWNAAHKCSASAVVKCVAESPLHAQLALCAILQQQDELVARSSRHNRGGGGGGKGSAGGVITLSDVEKKYKALCREAGLGAVRMQELADHLQAVELVEGRRRAVNRVSQLVLTPNVQWSDICSALLLSPNPPLEPIIPR